MWKERLRRAGPGIISGAANDDPSCILTYAIAGAAFGYATLWTSLFALPLVAVMQLLCSRIGMLSGRGLAGGVAVRRPKTARVLCALLAIANVVTLGADLGGMAEVTKMVTGAPAPLWVAVYGAALSMLLLFVSYREIRKVFKWLCLLLFAYVAAAFLSKPDWHAVALGTFVPVIKPGREYISVLVALMGATISPYFLFWQASQEVEDEYAIGRRTVRERKGATRTEIDTSTADVFAGSLISKLITYFITLTTAATLSVRGVTYIETAGSAAAALEPAAGHAASWLFALGIIGTGILAVPVLAGSIAYASAEAMGWKASLQEKPAFAPQFYAVLLACVGLGMALVYAGIPAVRLLFWASLLNGVLAPACIACAVLLAGNRSLMAGRAAAPGLRWVGWSAFAVTAVAAALLVW